MATDARRPEIRPVRVPQRPVHAAGLRLLRHRRDELRPRQVLCLSRPVHAERLAGIGGGGGSAHPVPDALPRAEAERHAPAVRRVRIASARAEGDGFHVGADPRLAADRRDLPGPGVRTIEEPAPRVTRLDDTAQIFFTRLYTAHTAPPP